MRKKSQTFVFLLLVVLGLAASILVPLVRGASPVDLGLDLAGGVRVVYRPDFSSRLDLYEDFSEDELLALAKETLKSRLYRALSSVPEVMVRGDGTIVVAVPAVQDYREVLELVGKTYHLTVRLVEGQSDHESAGRDLYRYGGRWLELGPPAFSGDMLDERYIDVVTGENDPYAPAPPSAKVAFRFKAPHDEAFAELTRQNVGRQLAILLDDEVEWAGTIESTIRGTGVLAGGYGVDEATEIAQMLRSGTLPISLEVADLEAVGASLGQEVQELGLESLGLAVGLLALLVGLAYAHRKALLVAGWVSLASLLVVLGGLVAVFGLTLDMVGIAGIVLSVGMGMDAFILVFEALEERRREASGRPWGEGVVRGAYSLAGAGGALFHANVTTLLVILLLLSSERLQSFAVFIFAGITASVLTIFVTREVLRRTANLEGGFGPDLLGWLRRTSPGVFRFRKVYFTALLLLFAVTVWSLAGGAGLGLGADFEAGTQVVVTSPDAASLDAALDDLGGELAGVAMRHQSLGRPEAGRHLVTVGTVLQVGEGAAPGTLGAEHLVEVFADHGVAVEGLSSIDGKVSAGRLFGSLAVLGLSFVLLGLYFLAFQGPLERMVSSRAPQRPEPARTRMLVFAGVLLAVLTDVAVVAAFLVLSGTQVSLPVVAALLTIVGYSVNDSVVLWSHVRGQRPAAGDDAVAVVGRGVDRVLARAVLTSLSTLVPALTILAVGLEPLLDFAWVMIVGTVQGTLSSLFVVGAFAVRAIERQPRTRDEVARAEAAALDSVAFS